MSVIIWNLVCFWFQSRGAIAVLGGIIFLCFIGSEIVAVWTCLALATTELVGKAILWSQISKWSTAEIRELDICVRKSRDWDDFGHSIRASYRFTVFGKDYTGSCISPFFRDNLSDDDLERRSKELNAISHVLFCPENPNFSVLQQPEGKWLFVEVIRMTLIAGLFYVAIGIVWPASYAIYQEFRSVK